MTPCLRLSARSVAVANRRPTFHHHILGVLLRRTEEQMVRANAARVITAGAVVADEQPVFYRSVMDQPRRTAGREQSPCHVELAVPATPAFFGRRCCSPKPAVVADYDFLHEPRENHILGTRVLLAASLRAELAATLPNIGWLQCHQNAAQLTAAFDTRRAHGKIAGATAIHPLSGSRCRERRSAQQTSKILTHRVYSSVSRPRSGETDAGAFACLNYTPTR